MSAHLEAGGHAVDRVSVGRVGQHGRFAQAQDAGDDEHGVRAAMIQLYLIISQLPLPQHQLGEGPRNHTPQEEVATQEERPGRARGLS
jgi:hypothetical protein